jgi:protein-tyrosine phosphatase
VPRRVDLHCHILPALDDGAVDLDDAVAMARQAQADGISVVCATPHVRHDHDVRAHDVARRVAVLGEALRAAAVPVVIVPGGEVAETALDGLDDAELRAVSLGAAGGWVLLEPRPGPLGDSYVATVDALARRGYGTVVAHPERHAGPDLAQRLTALVERGALVQATAADVAAGPAAEFLLELAESGLVHLVGSDAHSSRAGRPVAISAALERLAALPRLRRHVDWVACDGPSAIVSGERVAAPFAAV